MNRLVGRDVECGELRAVLAAALAARTQLVALRGDPGIGKTRLLEYLVTEAGAFRVVWVQGHEAERAIPFAALSMLVGPLIDDRNGAVDLPEGQGAALRSALNRGPAVHGDLMGVAAATLSVLATAAERQPLLLVVDDVHLIDQPTMATLFFALRRTHGERIAAVITARSESDVGPVVEQWLDPIRQIRLHGLDLESARRLTADRGKLSAAVWKASGGNPLALLEMTAADIAVFLDEPMQLSARLTRAYGRRLTSLTSATCDALLLLAVAGGASDVLDAALAHRLLSRDDLEPAEEAGLVVTQAGSFAFAHPLVCSAVYHSASPARKRLAHRALVAAYDGRVAPGVAERRAFHLAEATVGPDEGVAHGLAAAAKAAEARCSHTTAAALYEKAAMLSPPGAARTRRIIDAALAGQAAGTLQAAGPLLDIAIAETDDLDLHTAAMHLQCRVQMWSGRPAEARDQLLDLADRMEQRHRAWSAVMRSQAAVVSIALGEPRPAAEMAQRAEDLVEGLPDAAALPVLLACAVTRAINGEVGSARDLLARCAPHLPHCNPLTIDQLLVLAALAYTSLGDIGTARALLETAVGKARSAQAAGLLPFQLSWLTLVCWLDGDWIAALANGHAAVRVADETGWATELPNCLIALATVEAALGRDAETREHVAHAARLGAQQSVARVFAAHAARVTGLLELGAGRPLEAAEQLSVAAEFARAGHLGDPVLFNWAGDLTEALVGAGRSEEAARAYRSVLQEAEQTGRQSALAVAARCAGLLAESLEDGRTAFATALRRHAEGGQPFELARTQLCFGEFLNRHGRRAAAREQLSAALATFSRLGAAPWAHRVETELSAIGVTARLRASSVAERLTPQELQVAVVVAEGVTNAEAAAQLFLSPKTIEFHLSNVYRKLRVRSRTALARMLLTGLSDVAPSDDATAGETRPAPDAADPAAEGAR